uniref:rhombosortase n=1 Tax=Ningiella ruwaisensis TaxID=2364274 RepID=UPI0014471A92|nr:rhombosortase [Ningiella ruwaisensis]
MPSRLPHRSCAANYATFAVAVALGALCIVLFYLSHFFNVLNIEQLALRADAITNGRYYQLVTAHFIHTNSWHLLLNMGGLAITYLLFYEHLRLVRTLFAIAFCTVGLSICLLAFTDITWYAGLSGTLHGLFTFALVFDLQSRRVSSYALAGIGLAKLFYEQMGGSTADTAALIDVNVAVDGHLYGAICGFIAGLIISASVSIQTNQFNRRK